MNPKKTRRERRWAQLTALFTVSELNEIKTAAKAREMKYSAWAREKLLETARKE